MLTLHNHHHRNQPNSQVCLEVRSNLKAEQAKARVILVAGLLFGLAILHHADEEVRVSLLRQGPEGSRGLPENLTWTRTARDFEAQ